MGSIIVFGALEIGVGIDEGIASVRCRRSLMTSWSCCWSCFGPSPGGETGGAEEDVDDY